MKGSENFSDFQTFWVTWGCQVGQGEWADWKEEENSHFYLAYVLWFYKKFHLEKNKKQFRNGLNDFQGLFRSKILL